MIIRIHSILGKTSILYRLCKKSWLQTTPTFGFNVETLMHSDYNITFWDMGGSAPIRDLWKDYFFRAHGKRGSKRHKLPLLNGTSLHFPLTMRLQCFQLTLNSAY